MRLPLSPEYVEYRAVLGRFQTKKRWMRATPLLALTGTLMRTGIAYDRCNQAANTLEEDQDLYEIDVDPESIAGLKGTTCQGLQGCADEPLCCIGLYVLAGAATWYLFDRTAGWEVPVFEDKEKLRFDGLSWMPNAHGSLFADYQHCDWTDEQGLVIALVVTFMLGSVSCKKDELVLADLTTNPFDVDYDGAPIFTVVSSSTSFVTVNGVLMRQLKVTVQVHTGNNSRPTPYIVRVDRLFDGTSSSTVPSGERTTASTY
ncbi:MAG: hypothetical protein R2818_01575 [Flavobacteriales bacterium]